MSSQPVLSSGSLLPTLRPRNSVVELDDRRIGQRFNTAQQVELCVQTHVVPAELVNLSDRGARLRISQGAVPAIGGRLTIRLLDRTTLLGITRWVGYRDVGIQFFDTTINAENHLYYDERGRQLFSLILQQQRRLVSHIQLICDTF